MRLCSSTALFLMAMVPLVAQAQDPVEGFDPDNDTFIAQSADEAGIQTFGTQNKTDKVDPATLHGDVPKQTPYPVNETCPLLFTFPDVKILKQEDPKWFQLKIVNQGDTQLTVDQFLMDTISNGGTTKAPYDATFYKNQGLVLYPGTSTIATDKKRSQPLKITAGTPAVQLSGGSNTAAGGYKTAKWTNVVVPAKTTVYLAVNIDVLPYSGRQTYNIAGTGTYKGVGGVSCSQRTNRGANFQVS